MSEYIKKRIVKNLISEIQCLGAIELELVGHNVVSLLESQRMVHRGINKDYKPVGHTVDSFSPDSTIVAEYSTEKGYFEDSTLKAVPTYDKIEKDLNHAQRHNQPNGPDKIYLISTEEEIPSFRAKFNSTPLAKKVGDKVIILDARELAKSIYELSLKNDTIIRFFADFFPRFLAELNNYEYYGKVPGRCDMHVSAANIIDAVNAHYARGIKVCVLHGLSGAGKTQAAIDYIHQSRDCFYNYLWINGDDWKKDTSLSAIQRSRGGTPINIAGAFNASKTILVIDNFERGIDQKSFSELADGFDKGGVVLVTSQLSVPGNEIYLPIPTLPEDVALKVLGEESETASKTCKKFVKVCLFSPLILATARNMVRLLGVNGDAFYREVLNDPKAINGDDGKSIMRQILSKLQGGERAALSKIANSGLTIHDSDFLREFVGINACINLQRLSIVMPSSTTGVVKIHDLVYLAMHDEDNSVGLVEAIEKYIAKHEGEMEFGVLRQIHLAKKQIYDEHLRRGKRNPDWLTYALLQLEGEDEQVICEQIHTNEITSDMDFASVVSIIDSKEIYSYSIEDREERLRYYKDCAQDYESFFAASENEEVKTELLFHRGKALRRCGCHKEALECFKQHLNIKPNWHATYGQIAHLGSQYKADEEMKAEGQKAFEKLMKSVLGKNIAVPLRVSLAAISRLRSYWEIAKSINTKPVEVQTLSDIIAMSALEGFGQFYEAFVAFTSLFRYDHGKCCIDLAEALPEMLATPPSLVDERQWVNACDALTNMAEIAVEMEDKQNLFCELKRASCAFADAISAAEVLKSFNARAVAKAYINAEEFEKALLATEKVPKNQVDHWLLHVKSKALLALEARKEALQSARQAFELASKDPKGNERISIYHERLSFCHEALGNVSAALKECALAIDRCNNDKYKEALKAHFEKLQMLSL